MLKTWNHLPKFMKTKEVRPYWKVLYKRRGQLALKRAFDFIVAAVLLIILAIPMLVIGIMIKLDSKGPVFFRQERVTAYGRIFRIHKFRTMVTDADKKGQVLTVGIDPRITKVGHKIRKYRLDELPQLIDVLKGDMTFVGTRPEVMKYVMQYKKAYNATLLLPAGITSEASIKFKDEAKLLDGVENVDEAYINKILPQKMRLNLNDIRRFSVVRDLRIMCKTVLAVINRN
ncbi:MAG: sugar transferase [Lachnospiraceae bacterium]|nr:sugar transferase [Lachnospiraceae bacterium]